jgi:MFS family permease
MGMGAFIGIGGVFASTFTHSFPLFYFTFAVMYGCGIGFCYFVPLMCGWEYFPDRKGMVSGIIIGGFGFGAFIFGFVSTAIVNPEDFNPATQTPPLKYYPIKYAERTPVMLRWLCLMWLILVVIALSLVKRNPRFV